ncbi:MAG: glycosyltransferase [Clostridia bacterium]|nr:glycosyltransferase [Clostridia bacterium]
MKIMFYIDVLYKGGAERVISNLANFFSTYKKYNVYLVVDKRVNNEYQIYESVNFVSLEKSNKHPFSSNISRIYLINKLIKKYNIDILVSFKPGPVFRSIIASKFTKAKTIISIRNDPRAEYGSVAAKILSRILFKKTDGIVFQTKEASNFFKKNIVSKSIIIKNPVSDVFFQTQRKPPFHDIVSFGRISSAKNHILLVNAFAIISKTFPKEKLYIYGNIDDKRTFDSLRNAIVSLKLENRIFLKEHSTCVNDLLSSAKLFVLSSNFEGMPNALMEAMAVGVPCISTDCPVGGPRELLGNSEYGLLTKVSDENDLAIKMKYLLSSSSRINFYGDLAKQRSKVFSSDKIYEQWDAYFQKVYETKRGRK